jgi:hypothetical protein
MEFSLSLAKFTRTTRQWRIEINYKKDIDSSIAFEDFHAMGDKWHRCMESGLSVCRQRLICASSNEKGENYREKRKAYKIFM